MKKENKKEQILRQIKTAKSGMGVRLVPASKPHGTKKGKRGYQRRRDKKQAQKEW